MVYIPACRSGYETGTVEQASSSLRARTDNISPSFGIPLKIPGQRRGQEESYLPTYIRTYVAYGAIEARVRRGSQFSLYMEPHHRMLDEDDGEIWSARPGPAGSGRVYSPLLFSPRRAAGKGGATGERERKPSSLLTNQPACPPLRSFSFYLSFPPPPSPGPRSRPSRRSHSRSRLSHLLPALACVPRRFRSVQYSPRSRERFSRPPLGPPRRIPRVPVRNVWTVDF